MSTNEVPLELEVSPYGYIPTRYVCYIFLVLYVVSTVLHLGQALHHRAWWLLPTAVLAGSGEVLGWSARLWSSYSPLAGDPYLMQMVCTIIAPTPLVAALFISFGRLSTRLGEQYGRLSANLYSKVFLTIDLVSLVVQSAGGGIAASTDDHNTSEMGSKIMLAGIILQLVSLSVFAILVAEYLVRYIREAPVRPLLLRGNSSEMTVSDIYTEKRPMESSMKLLILGISMETLFLFIRAIYRTIELADGFNGRIIQTEIYFNVLDGVMVVLAMYTLSVLHPARLFHQFDLRQSHSNNSMKSMNIISSDATVNV
ncbi:RTA1-domain-containing protein [Polyporus arcularius HHB13444]|uniref:RTA1-domain-containing protein n=1 Tax=Polyporus arcularius HHB13444 TaxID=1314778 RepID=A0A5C3Q4U0_9APHY|nr:RTA1-domain-containing protein [Polyporus arcularius HHB13444]